MLVACCFSLSLPSYMRFNPNSSVSCVAAALNIFLLTPVNKRKIIFCHKLTNKPLCEYMFTTAKGIPSAIIMGISVMTIIWFYSYPINSLAILIQPVYLFIYNYAVLFTPFYRPSELFLFQNHYTPDNLFIYPLISLFWQPPTTLSCEREVNHHFLPVISGWVLYHGRWSAIADLSDGYFGIVNVPLLMIVSWYINMSSWKCTTER